MLWRDNIYLQMKDVIFTKFKFDSGEYPEVYCEYHWK